MQNLHFFLLFHFGCKKILDLSQLMKSGLLQVHEKKKQTQKCFFYVCLFTWRPVNHKYIENDRIFGCKLTGTLPLWYYLFPQVSSANLSPNNKNQSLKAFCNYIYDLSIIWSLICNMKPLLLDMIKKKVFVNCAIIQQTKWSK